MVVPDVRAVLADVGGIGPFFAVATDTAAPGEGWVAVRALGKVDGPLADRVAAVGAALGTGGRVAASIAFQGIAAQVVAPLFAAVAVHGVLPTAGRPGDRVGAIAATLHWRPGGAGPWSWWPGDTGRIVPCPDAAVLGTTLAGLLAPVVAGVRAQVPVSERVLWGNVASSVAESFEEGLLEHPQYTRPPVFRGAEVPAVLQSGNHARIAKWRRWKALTLTRERRPDLFGRLELGPADQKLLAKREEEL